MRVWIEINKHDESKWFSEFHPLMRVWIEMISKNGANKFIVTVSPSYEGVD